MWGIPPDEFDGRAAAGAITPADMLEVYWLSGFEWQNPQAVRAYVFRESMMERRALIEEMKALIQTREATADPERREQLRVRIAELQEKLDPED